MLVKKFVSSEGKDMRSLYAGEFERMLGLDVNASNEIAKIPEQPLEAREARRKNLLFAVIPIPVLKFVLNSTFLSARGAPPINLPPSQFADPFKRGRKA